MCVYWGVTIDDLITVLSVYWGGSIVYSVIIYLFIYIVSVEGDPVIDKSFTDEVK